MPPPAPAGVSTWLAQRRGRREPLRAPPQPPLQLTRRNSFNGSPFVPTRAAPAAWSARKLAVGVPVPVNALGVPIKRAASAAAAARGGAWVAATPSGGRVLLSSSPPSPPGEREALRRVGARLRALGRSAADAQRVVLGLAGELAGKDDVARGVLLDEVGEYLAHEEFMCAACGRAAAESRSHRRRRRRSGA